MTTMTQTSRGRVEARGCLRSVCPLVSRRGNKPWPGTSRRASSVITISSRGQSRDSKQIIRGNAMTCRIRRRKIDSSDCRSQRKTARAHLARRSRREGDEPPASRASSLFKYWMPFAPRRRLSNQRDRFARTRAHASAISNRYPFSK